MSGDLLPQPSPRSHEFVDDVHELISEDGSTIAYASEKGAQLRAGDINGRQVVLPLLRPHSVSTDFREDSHNTFGEGETTAPGGSFPSFGGGAFTDTDGSDKKLPVHGPFSAAWFTHAYQKIRDKIQMHADPSGWTKPFFRKGELYSMDREIQAGNGEITLGITVVNKGAAAVTPPELVEHLYLVGGKHEERGEAGQARILDKNGDAILPESLPRRAEPNGNAIDSRISSGVTGTPGECAFLPYGETGHVVVVSAYITGPDDVARPVNEFCVYRFEDSDPENTDPAKNDWTAVEPIAENIGLQPGQSFTLTTHIRTFESLEDYREYRNAVLQVA